MRHRKRNRPVRRKHKQLGHRNRGQLERRFQEYDARKNWHLLPICIVCISIVVLTIFVVDRFDVPAGGWLVAGSAIVALVIAAVWLGVVIESLTTTCGLRCARCDRPLDKLPPLRRRARRTDPDDRADGTIPRRCPHCRVSIEEAAARENNE